MARNRNKIYDLSMQPISLWWE